MRLDLNLPRIRDADCFVTNYKNDVSIHINMQCVYHRQKKIYFDLQNYKEIEITLL